MIVGNAKPTPTPPISQPGRKSAAYDGCAPTLDAMSSVPTANNAEPSAARRPGGTRPESRWATSVKTGTISGPGASPRPVCSADQRHTSCSQSTAASRAAPNAAENTTAVTLDHANARTRSSASSTTGRACVDDRTQKPANDAAATTNAATTPTESQPQLGPFTRPN